MSALQKPVQIRLKRRWPKRLFLVVMASICFGVILHLSHFLKAIHQDSPLKEENAEGIVVLTGGQDRIKVGLRLLEAQKASRLLISGVHPDARAEEISQLAGSDPWLFSCCVDLDRRALNTIGNARETLLWVQERDIQSLIVVTSHYHMPRSMQELEARMEDVHLIRYPVKTKLWQEKSALSLFERGRIVFFEYLKFTLSQIRLFLHNDVVPFLHKVYAQAYAMRGI